MCAKTPKAAPITQKDPVYLRNPFLDGVKIGAGTGRNALRIDLGSGPQTGQNPPTIKNPIESTLPIKNPFTTPTAPGTVAPSGGAGLGGMVNPNLRLR